MKGKERRNQLMKKDKTRSEHVRKMKKNYTKITK